MPKDPATDAVAPNKETVIEIKCDKKPLGVVVVKGDSSVVQVSGIERWNNGAVIVTGS